MRASEFYPDSNNPLVMEFIAKFGGYFMASIFDALEYVDEDENSYGMPETEAEFFDLLSTSIKTGKNGFFQYPKDDDMPEDALI